MHFSKVWRMKKCILAKFELENVLILIYLL